MSNKKVSKTAYIKAYYRRRREMVIKELGETCAICGARECLEIDHINGYDGAFSPNGSRGGYRNLQSAINLIKAGRKAELTLLCSACNKNCYHYGRRGT